jgi:hypothetical protein
MELFHVHLSAADLISGPGPLVVTHGATGLAAVLVEGQEVLVSDRDGEFHAAVVLSVDSSQGEPIYAVHIGARLPMEMAAQRLTDVDMLPDNQGLHEVVDLPGDLRRPQSFTRQP